LKRSNRLVLLIGIFLAVVAFVLIIVAFRGNQTQTPTEVSQTQVVVASKDIGLGSTIQSSDVETKAIAKTDKPADSYTDTSFVVGQIARLPVTKGQLITSAVINGLSGRIGQITVPQGKVAIAVQVDQSTGVGTIIKSGDYVDIVTGITGTDKFPLVEASARPATGSPRPNATPVPAGFVPEVLPYNPTTVKTLIPGVQVLGTLLPSPQNVQQTGATPAPGSGTTTLNGQNQIVILAVSSQDAEVIKFAQIDGNISLVLRSSQDCNPSASPSPTPAASPSGPLPLPSPSPTLAPGATVTNCPIVPTTGITLRKLVDNRGVLPPQVIQVIQPTPYPSNPFSRP
jgi:Flp pilus assembly protein CpaB